MIIRSPLSRQLFASADDPAGGGGNGGGGGDPAPKLDPNNADVQAMIRAAVEKATGPLVAKRDELLGEVKTARETLGKFEGVDPDTVRSIVDRMEKDEDSKLLAKGDIEGYVGKKTKSLQDGFTREKAKLGEVVTAKDKEIAGLFEQISSLVLDGGLRKAAADLGLLPSAVDDAVFRGRAAFTVKDGKPHPKDDSVGADGALTLEEWLTAMREKAPHWWPAPKGGGGQESAGSRGTLTPEQVGNLSAAEYEKWRTSRGAAAR
ncbi:MAG TPA: hypothetical protein VK735_40220 [Pseudonocardia sp.]|uniref:hypothetical protein n=1 Tax=Pseudonocardia sp. TaxID=60912 RepID=UPI002CB15D0C|nr:hypothetical protein [Pseudonocardia sp.]HTF53712.1 hypothetical protein [Pseudonocardia sp.]